MRAWWCSSGEDSLLVSLRRTHGGVSQAMGDGCVRVVCCGAKAWVVGLQDETGTDGKEGCCHFRPRLVRSPAAKMLRLVRIAAANQPRKRVCLGVVPRKAPEAG